MTAGSVIDWFGAPDRNLGFTGCSAHSGRRTFITRAARRLTKGSSSLREVQELAGHRSLTTTNATSRATAPANGRLIALP